MDFLDPKKQKNYKIRLILGYCLVTVALVLTTIVLLYQAYGFGLDKNGKIIQSGLVFVSSTPNPANIYINGVRYKDNTNVRIPLPSGQYTFELWRNGYNSWKRAISVEGGSVEHFDYPFLFPSKLQTTAVKNYDLAPVLTTESPDRHWLLLQTGDNHFESYDLTVTPKKLTAKDVTLPDGVVTVTAAGTQSVWELAQWSTDNRHVVLKHSFTDKNKVLAYEFILVDRVDPTQSVNLTSTWGVNPTSIEMRNRKYDQYYLFDKTAGTLMTATLKVPTPVKYLDHVLAFKSYGNDLVLYATDKGTPAGKVNVVWHQGTSTHYTLRTMPAGGPYLVDLTQYSGDWYVAAGSAVEGKVYVYREPVAMLKSLKVTVPVHILKVPQVSYVEFSDNARFIMAENGSQFALYDAENDKGYAYDTKKPIDSPQVHATWMDGHRLMYVSGGKLMIFDFDSANKAALPANSPAFLPAFSGDYKYLYTIAPNADGSKPAVLNQTPLRTPQDL